jgi:hypothetical protein
MRHPKLHKGIRIDSIPAEEAGGLIFAAGVTSIFLLGIPAFIPLVAFSIIAGVALAPVLHRLGH